MLQLLLAKASDRKLRLFMIACVRRLSLSSKDERIEQVIQTSQLYSDNKADWIQLSDARKVCKLLRQEAMQRRGTLSYGAGLVAWVEATAHPSARIAAGRFSSWPFETADFLREVFGNPFRPMPDLDPTSLTRKDATIGKIAQAIYDEHAFDRLAILADAFEEAGCNNEDILNHCRGPGPHVRGGWVVDLVLGKQ
jgi:hypothetical protein